MNTPATRPRYRERLAPSLWMLITIALAGPMVALVFVPVGATLALVLGAAVSLLLVTAGILLSPVIEVDGTVLRAGRAHIDVRWLGDAEQRTGEDARRARGPDLAHDGWHLVRGGIDGVVVVPLTDPDDPHSAWTLSSRTPDRLAAAIRAARQETERAPI
ncbi:DUF3093 domain-containing protein [Microbacterium bovistercoris]|uniref:DUF3093 domain-containing protein n=1 Tax=Microbacterium bovistercoris TaxID=2293570 RepID=A0A371NTM0_9MICO|nr:DUF3093 domain-containing protein [Microbacterium bovistercoris]REJ05616.1 DUF3093 domain-containing protein [Microbacterium bovistercoris]